MREGEGREGGRRGGGGGGCIYSGKKGELSSAHSLFCCLLSSFGRWMEMAFCRLLGTLLSLLKDVVQMSTSTVHYLPSLMARNSDRTCSPAKRYLLFSSSSLSPSPSSPSSFFNKGLNTWSEAI